MQARNLIRAVRLAVFMAVMALTSGCFLQAISGATFAVDGSLITTVRTDAILATCVQGGFSGGNIECTYFFLDANGIPVDSTSSADLISEFGFLGVVIDPLILQIPADAVHVSGTYETNSGAMGNLVVTSGYKTIPADSRRTLVAERGTQFVIAKLPNGLPFDGVTFTLELKFEQPPGSPTPVQVKPLLAAEYIGNNEHFQIPLLPCTTDMADVPAFTIPVADEPQPLALPTSPITTCSNEQYLLVGFGGFGCDIDRDSDIDRDDIRLLARARGGVALPGDSYDADGSGMVDLYDTRQCARQCTRPRCAR